MFKTEGHLVKKVWKNGKIQEDIEVTESGDNQGIELVIRDKDNVKTFNISSDELLREYMGRKSCNLSLNERLGLLLSNSKKSATRKKTSRDGKNKENNDKGKGNGKGKNKDKRKTKRK